MRSRRAAAVEAKIAAEQAAALVAELAALNDEAAGLIAELSASLDVPPSPRKGRRW